MEAPARAARLLIAAQSIRGREGIGLRRIDELQARELFASVADALTAAQLDVARADSRAMDVHAAVEYALANPGN